MELADGAVDGVSALVHGVFDEDFLAGGGFVSGEGGNVGGTTVILFHVLAAASPGGVVGFAVVAHELHLCRTIILIVEYRVSKLKYIE